MGFDKMTASVTFVTATYNKGIILADAGFSVLGQSRPDWEWWIVLNGPDRATEAVAARFADMDKRIKVFDFPTTVQTRREKYLPAVIANEYYPKVTTPYFTWLSDDDILDPLFIQVLAGALEANPYWDVVYGHLEFMRCWDERSIVADYRWICAHSPIGMGTGISPDCRIDSGQILQTKRLWDMLGEYRIPEEWEYACHVDGIYMAHLAQYATFYPVDAKVLSHVKRPLSTWRKR